MNLRRTSSILAFVAALGAPAAAAADESPPASDSGSEGLSPKGLPLSQRGNIGLDVSGLLIANSGNVSSMSLGARVPLSDRTFLDANVPFGFMFTTATALASTFTLGAATVGNPTIGARHVLVPADQVWLSLGFAIGAPLTQSPFGVTFATARAFWDAHDFAGQTLPLIPKIGFETHFGLGEVRVEADPVAHLSIAKGVDSQFVFQHAGEIQIGHTIGGGLRYQGVLMSAAGDKYQGAFEPFFVLDRKLFFLRLGILMPIDKPLGIMFDNAWGARMTTGFHLD